MNLGDGGGGRVSQQSGSGCKARLHLSAAIPKVNFQEETQTNELLTLQEDLERFGSPAGGTDQSKWTAYLLTLNVYVLDGGNKQSIYFFNCSNTINIFY